MTLAEAVDLVARTILAETWNDGSALVPLISDKDFRRVMARTTELAPYPDQDAYDEARAFLAARAGEG